MKNKIESKKVISSTSFAALADPANSRSATESVVSYMDSDCLASKAIEAKNHKIADGLDLSSGVICGAGGCSGYSANDEKEESSESASFEKAEKENGY